MDIKIYNIPLVGDIIVKKHPQAKSLKILLKPGQSPKVIIPKLMPFDMGFRFAIEKTNWITQHQQKLLAKLPTQKIYTDNAELHTRFTIVKIGRNTTNSIIRKNDNNIIWLLFPENTDITLPKYQNLIKNFFTEILRKEAKKYLPQRLKTLANQYQFKYNNVTVKNIKTRWGSCSFNNNINLNMHLMRLPEHLSDFVVLHELCHTIHKNHGPLFHQLLNKITGDEKTLNKQLKQFQIEL